MSPWPRRAVLAMCFIASAMLAGCKENEEAQRMARLAGQYESTRDQTLLGERHQERHVLKLTETGYWVRTGGTQIGDRPVKVTRDSGQYRVHGDTMLILMSQLQEKPFPMRYRLNADTIWGYNFAALGLNKESVFIRQTP